MFQVNSLETRRKIGIYGLAGALMLAMANVVKADDKTCLWRSETTASSSCLPDGASFQDAASVPHIRAGTLVGAKVFAADGTPLAVIKDFVFNRNNQLQDVIVTTVGHNAFGGSPDEIYAVDANALRVVRPANALSSNGSVPSGATSSVIFQADKKDFIPFRYDWHIQSIPKHVDAIAVDEVTYTSLTSAYVINREGEVLGASGDIFIAPTGRIGYVLLDELKTGKRIAIAYRPLPTTDTNDIVLDIERSDLKTAPEFDPQQALQDAV